MKKNRLIKGLAATILVATMPFTLASCAKGGSTASNDSDAGGTKTISMWTHNAGNKNELAAIEAVVKDYNASQTNYKVEVQAFPQDSYNQSVVSAAAAKKLPCVLDIDGPNVPNWAWAGYLAPIEGMDDTFSKFLPTVLGKYNDKTYSYGYYDVALTMVTRASILKKYDIRVPTTDKPWTKDELTAALEKIKASGDYDNPLDIATSFTGEWWPYAYSPFLQSFGGDLINRDGYETAEGVLNGPQAVEWATWFRSLVTEKYAPLKSGADPAADFMNGKTAILYNGSWTAVATREKFDDVLFLPSVDLGQGTKIGGGSWQWGMSTNCETPEGAADYLKFAAQDKYVASVSKATTNIPATDAAAAEVPGFGPGEENEIFLDYAKKFAVLRPVTPGYPFIATEFTKTAQDILNGADPQQSLDQAVKNIDANQKSNNYFR
ncbi:MAG TPA: sugar ABC transporter substrate-binding protein [Microlunatus sp.]